jgi:hypothetical protein
LLQRPSPPRSATPRLPVRRLLRLPRVSQQRRGRMVEGHPFPPWRAAKGPGDYGSRRQRPTADDEEEDDEDERGVAEREGFEPSARIVIRARGFQPRSFGPSDTSPPNILPRPAQAFNAPPLSALRPRRFRSRPDSPDSSPVPGPRETAAAHEDPWQVHRGRTGPRRK